MIACTEDTATFKQLSSLKGDEIAYKQMFLRFYPLLLNYLLLHNFSTPDSEGIVSGAFRELWLQRSKERGQNIKLYLFKKAKEKIESHRNKLNGNSVFSINAVVLKQFISLPYERDWLVEKIKESIN